MNQAELVEALRQFSTTELCDGMTTFRVLDSAIQRMVTTKKIVGPAFPVEVPAGRSGILPAAVEAAEPGQVMVVAAQGYTKQTCWGDHRSLCAVKKKLEGVVIDGTFRDREGCEEVGFPIFARGTCPRAGSKEPLGQINVPVILGDVLIRPGDIIVGDADGVVVIVPEEAEEVMERAAAKRVREEEAIRRLKESMEA